MVSSQISELKALINLTETELKNILEMLNSFILDFEENEEYKTVIVKFENALASINRIKDVKPL